MRFRFTTAALALLNWLYSVRSNTGSAKNLRSHQLASHSFMKFKVILYATTILAALLAIPGPLAAEQDLSKVEKKTGKMDARTLLEKGRASGSLPEGIPQENWY